MMRQPLGIQKNKGAVKTAPFNPRLIADLQLSQSVMFF